jgi:hypothetical protein
MSFAAWKSGMNDDTTVEQRLWLWADELRAVANEGLHFDGDSP